jgi:two-component system KDP operon response regulator KdpE
MSDKGLRVLVVDDETAVRRFLRTSLAANGYAVLEANSGAGALAAVVNQRPDMLILDLGLPDMDGIEVVQDLREWATLPIIILSVRDREADKIAALDSGADDYLVKPFSVGELMARIRVALRHLSQPAETPLFESGDLRVDLAHRVVSVSGREVQLTPTEYDLLKTLVVHAGKVLTHRQLLQKVWGMAYDDDAHLLRVHISNLRSKLEQEPARPCYILTEPGVGYRLQIHD